MLPAAVTKSASAPKPAIAALPAAVSPCGTPRLVVRLDHVAALREVRGGRDPDPAAAAVLADIGGADGVVVHLREDRRHIQDQDVRGVRAVARRLILEIALDDAAIRFAREVLPPAVRFVPPGRQDVTVTFGLDCHREPQRLQRAVRELTDAGIDVSCSIDADPRQIGAAVATGVRTVELNTGRYAAAREAMARDVALADLAMAAAAARERGLRIVAGRGLDVRSLAAIVALPGVEELCLGHAVVARAMLLGFQGAVAEAKAAVAAAAAQHMRGTDGGEDR